MRVFFVFTILCLTMAIASCGPSREDVRKELMIEREVLTETQRSLESELLANENALQKNKEYFEDLAVQIELEKKNLEAIKIFHVVRTLEQKESKIKEKIEWIKTLEINRQKVARQIRENERYQSTLEGQLSAVRTKVEQNMEALDKASL